MTILFFHSCALKCTQMQKMSSKVGPFIKLESTTLKKRSARRLGTYLEVQVEFLGFETFACITKGEAIPVYKKHAIINS